MSWWGLFGCGLGRWEGEDGGQGGGHWQAGRMRCEVRQKFCFSVVNRALGDKLHFLESIGWACTDNCMDSC
jgi:hypothetical protein